MSCSVPDRLKPELRTVFIPSKNHAQVLRNLNITVSLLRQVLIEAVDEIRHFYQFPVVAQSRYPLRKAGVIQPNPNNQWNF
jgi:hypothetical protein